MKVSILIPVYGVERYIERCARSLMEQSYHDIEYVFVNDCTPDNSIQVLSSTVEQYPHRKSQVHIINHETNKGLAAARQTAIDASTGDAIMFVDSDDYIKTNTVECLVEVMKSSHVDVVDGGLSVVINGAKKEDYLPLHLSIEAYVKTVLCQSLDTNRVVGRLFNRNIFTDNSIKFIQGVDYGEDFSVTPRVLAHASRGWVDECFYYYCSDNPESYTNNISTKNAISFFKAQQIVGSFFCSDASLRNYRFAVEMGWVNAWRFARRFHVDKDLAKQHFKMEPTHPVTRFLTFLMNSHIPYSLVNFLYKSVRTIFLKSVR